MTHHLTHADPQAMRAASQGAGHERPTPSEIPARVEEIEKLMDLGCALHQVDARWLLNQLRAALQDTQPTTQQVEQAARAICDEWGYDWDCPDRADAQACGNDLDPYDERPSKALFRRAARKALAALSSTPGGPR